MWTPTVGLMMVSVKCPLEQTCLSPVSPPQARLRQSEEPWSQDELSAGHLRQEGL